ncbi:MAG: hypothetical protein JXA46_07190 [Dehalococcoidales bacterium]|nr:hypothetical protein [Dehalococcoidales bacterium]
MSNEGVKLELLDPRGEIEVKRKYGLSKRIDDLDGKRIALIHNQKTGSIAFLEAMEELLREKYPSAVFVKQYTTSINQAREPEFYDDVVRDADAFIFAAGDCNTCTFWGSYHTAELEKRGIPGVYFVSSNFMVDARSSAAEWSVPSMRMFSLPGDKWHALHSDASQLRPIAVQALSGAIDLLTRHLAPEESSPPQEKQVMVQPVDFDIRSDSYAAACEKFNELFLENHMGDGLPLVPPTAERLEWMMKGTSRSPDEKLGKCPLKMGTATVRKIAINSVMAGAKPEYLPVILAAMDGFISESGKGKDGEFLFHTLGSSGAFNLVIMVNGPVVKEININSGMGLFGHGWRSNNTIGRAVRLSTINIGYCWPGINDMALTGRPSAHTWFTFGENEDMSQWEPYHVTRGFSSEDSTVTVAKVNSTYATFGGMVAGLLKAESILEQIAGRLGKMGGAFIVVNPDVHRELIKKGFDRKGVQEWLSGKSGMPARNIQIAVAGGVPGYTVVWNMLNINALVTKKIHGALLTRSGL